MASHGLVTDGPSRSGHVDQVCVRCLLSDSPLVHPEKGRDAVQRGHQYGLRMGRRAAHRKGTERQGESHRETG